jgi:cell division septal protein FtsQ
MSRLEPVRRPPARRGGLLRNAVLLVGCMLALSALGFGLTREAGDPRFWVEIASIGGCVHTSPEQVVSAAALPPRQNVWLLNRAALTRRIEALPWVDRVALEVGWPNKLRINIVERRPVARVAIAPLGGEEEPVPHYAVIDETQRVLTVSADPTEMAWLPVLVLTPPPAGEAVPGSELDSRDAAQALDAYRRLSSLGLHVSEVAIAPSTGISATADRNLHVLFGEDEDLAKKAQLFQAIVAKISTTDRVAYVDVRSIRAPTVLYR